MYRGHPLVMRSTSMLVRRLSMRRGGRQNQQKDTRSGKRGVKTSSTVNNGGTGGGIGGGTSPTPAAQPTTSKGMLFLSGVIGAVFGSTMMNGYHEYEKDRKRKNARMAMMMMEKDGKGMLAGKRGVGEVAWFDEVAGEDGAVKVLNAEDLIAQEHPFLEDDHMFSAFIARGIINDIEGYYVPQDKKFNAVVALGKEVAGFPRIVHGGLTAAIFDEAFGGLLFSLKKSGALKFLGPAYTVQLEVSYKSKISADSTILCSARLDKVEGRKLWMTATMSDGPDGRVYATSKALFVKPKPHKMISDVVKYMIGRLMEEKSSSP